MVPLFKKEGHPTAERMLPSRWSRVDKAKHCACARREGTWDSGGTDPLIPNLSNSQVSVHVPADLH